MSTITDLHGRMTEVLAGCADDAAKLDGGNKAAGMRLRKALKELKDLAQETRKTSIAVGKAPAGSSGAGACDSAACDAGGTGQ